MTIIADLQFPDLGGEWAQNGQGAGSMASKTPGSREHKKLIYGAGSMVKKAREQGQKVRKQGAWHQKGQGAGSKRDLGSKEQFILLIDSKGFERNSGSR